MTEQVIFRHPFLILPSPKLFESREPEIRNITPLTNEAIADASRSNQHPFMYETATTLRELVKYDIRVPEFLYRLLRLYEISPLKKKNYHKKIEKKYHKIFPNSF